MPACCCDDLRSSVPRVQLLVRRAVNELRTKAPKPKAKALQEATEERIGSVAATAAAMIGGRALQFGCNGSIGKRHAIAAGGTDLICIK